MLVYIFLWFLGVPGLLLALLFLLGVGRRAGGDEHVAEQWEARGRPCGAKCEAVVVQETVTVGPTVHGVACGMERRGSRASAGIAVFVFGLVGTAPAPICSGRRGRWTTSGRSAGEAPAFSVSAAFLSFAIAGWTAVRWRASGRSEPCILHGVAAWLVAVPLLALLANQGAGTLMGGWFGGLSASHPAWTSPRLNVVLPNEAPGSDAALARTEAEVRAAKVVRNTVLGLAAALLVGADGRDAGRVDGVGRTDDSHLDHRTRDGLVVAKA